MAHTIVNTDMAAAWDGDEGEDWARDWQRYDRAVEAYNGALLEAAAITATDRVLDVGCGNGRSTRDAARTARLGSATGVDLSSRMVARATELARVEAVTNVRFEQADAQAHAFDPARYDVALSRFGTMFFAGPVAAFANIGTAMRPGGRLVMVAWRGLPDNEWLRCVLAALAVGRELPVPPPGSPGPLGLADPDHVRAVLSAAGFEATTLTEVDRMVWLGADGADAFEYFRSTGVVRGMMHGLDDARRADALDALRATMVDHDTGDGVEFGSGAWLIAARRPAP